MDFNFSYEQKQYTNQIYNFAKHNLNDETKLDCFCMDQWKMIADFGLLGITINPEYNGLGESYLTAALAMEAIGHGSINNGLTFALTNHIWMVQNAINLFGTAEQKQRYLSDMVLGKKIGAFALTESDAGSDAMSIKAHASFKNSRYVLNGSKTFISNGTIADVFIVIALTNYQPAEYTAFIIEKSFNGVHIGREIKKMGLSSCPFCELKFSNCTIPIENVLGQVGSGSIIMNELLTWERCYEFAPHVGAMQRILERCVQYANERKQSGRFIKDFQAISHKIADMKVSIELSKNMLYKLAWLKDQGKSAYTEASIFKLFVSENYIKVCQNAMQIFGAYGYASEYGIERELRDAMACSIYSGTSEIQRNIIFQFIN